MAYVVDILGAAQHDVAALPPKILRQVDRRIRALSADPRPRGCKKLQGFTQRDLYRIRSGDYRIIYEINDAARRVIINKVKPRPVAYR